MTNVKIFKSYNFRELNTLHLDSIGDLYVVKTIDALKNLIEKFRFNNESYFIIGNGSNVVLDCELCFKIIKLDFRFNYDLEFSEVRSEYTIAANVHLKKLTSAAIRHSLSGWDVFTGIPATLGGAIYMNAGTAHGEISQIISSVDILKSHGEIVTITGDNLVFSYRKNCFVQNGDVILSATLTHNGQDRSVKKKIIKYLKERTFQQPLSSYTAGCTFKNDTNHNYKAGMFLDLIGFKGFCYKNLCISTVHANFIENKSSSNKEELVNLLQIIDNELESTYGFVFKKEIIL